MLDSAAWRGFPQLKTTQIKEAYTMVADIKHHVGTGLNYWGGIYPHEGKVTTSNDAKAVAVIAQRAGDMITSTGMIPLSGHIYQSLSNQCGQECKAAPVQENSPDTEFQMVYPVVSAVIISERLLATAKMLKPKPTAHMSGLFGGFIAGVGMGLENLLGKLCYRENYCEVI